MAKIKINKLPPGFKMVNGNIEEVEKMEHGGYVTGDQRDYGLVTTPQEYYGNTNFNNTDDISVRYSLSGVPKDKANIEAEGGETVLTDLSGDGLFGLYDIKGPRHSKGGVNMFLPEQSFIYSDTTAMKFGGEELASYGFNTKMKKTPAQISKRFGLNEHYASMDSEYADRIQSTSAELMLKKNMMYLSQLAFDQEAKKQFEEGVPLAAHPFLVSIGEDPIAFTAKVEEISRQQAQMNAIAALPPEQQAQLMMLQEMMAQAEQQQMQGQPQDGQPMEEVVEDSVVVEGMGRFGRELRRAQDGTETGSLPAGHPQKADWDSKVASGNYRVESNVRPDGSTEYTLISAVSPSTRVARRSAENRMGVGSVPIYNESISGQQRAIEEAENSGYQYIPGMLSEGNRPLTQSTVSGGQGFGSDEMFTDEARVDFENRWGDITATIEGFDYTKGKNDPQWKKFQEKAEQTRKNEHQDQFGNLDAYVPYFLKKDNDDYVRGRGFDSNFGLHTFNTPRLRKTEPTRESLVVPGTPTGTIPIPPPGIPTPGIPNQYFPPDADYWTQDVNNLQALNLINDDLYLPWAPVAEDINLNPKFDSWTGAVGANNAAASTMAQALGAVGGPQAVANSNIQGQTLDANAKAINRVNTNNLQIANNANQTQGQFDMMINQENAKRQMGVYDNTQKTLQAHDNFLNWKTAQSAALQNAALTNRADTFNLNTTYDNFAVDPVSGGMIGFTNPNALEKTGPESDRLGAYYDQVLDYERQTGNVMPDALVKALYPGQAAANINQNNYQQEIERIGVPQSYNPPAKRGKETKLKRMAVPFYTGKMGG
jgi:hypothetical protein